MTLVRDLPGEWLTTVQVAKLAGLSRHRIDQLRREGQIPAVRSPLGWLYYRAELEHWLAGRRGE